MAPTRGIDLARAHGTTLPQFADRTSARAALFRERDEVLARLRALTRASGVELDRTPASLRTLEAWYLDLHRRRGWARAGTTRAEVEGGLAYYLGVVAKEAVRGVRWVVEPYAFTPGRWEIGVATARHVVMLRGSCADWFRSTRPGRDDALLRRLRATWPTTPAKKRAPTIATQGDGAIRAAIESVLRLRASPALPAVELWSRVRHRVRDPRLPLRRVRAALDALVVSGRLVASDEKYVRYRLSGRS